jgi:hypothetical protein
LLVLVKFLSPKILENIVSATLWVGFTTTTCRQLGNDTTYDTEKKNPTSHDVADTSAMSGRRVGKTRHHVVKTNCGRHLKRRHFQLSKELVTQMHDINVFCPIEVESLTYDEKKKALSSLMFLKEKRDSLVKARMCAFGRKQKDGT